MVILAAIDGTEHAKAIVPLAYELAGKYTEPLVVLHVVPRDDYENHKKTLEEIPGLQGFSLNQEAESAERFAQRVVEEAIDDPGDDIEYRGRVGDISEETLAEMEALDPRFLVIRAQRRSPTGKAIFGSSAQRILLNATCPVVTKMSA